MTTLLARVALGALVLSACGGGTTDPEGPPMAELGTGIIEFEPITDGQDLEIVQGPQGGYHFIVAVRASGVIAGNPDDLGDPDNPRVWFRAYRVSDDARIDINNADFTQGLEYVPGSNGVFEMISRLVILDIADDSELDGVSVRLTVDITDIDGRTASDERTIVGVPHPANQ